MARSAAKKIEVTPQVSQEKKNITTSPNLGVSTPKHYIRRERRALVGLGALIMGLSCLVIWSNTTVTKAQAKIQKIDQQVSTLQTSNANMKEEISELSSRSRLMQVAKDVGLKMNDKNIRNVTK
ncbi:cell division protein FtsL [Ligilactobacillus faecis]|uniref:cell division protein FtsL n=1 Tax=Ligilactobacillus faecis TaxID=762833 RepID=UPI0024697811|nr:cell division protein FtsL [Ligilactobacillus faecis]WGN89442.1 cell division protein FtsL [Ligilactobacillus faecis]